MYCPHCHKEHPDHAQFCPVTGQLLPAEKSPVRAERFCPSCGTPAQPNWARCTQCGSVLPPVTPSTTNKTWLVIGVLLILGLCVALTVLWQKTPQGARLFAAIFSAPTSTPPTLEATLRPSQTPYPTRTVVPTSTRRAPLASATLRPSITPSRTARPSPTLTSSPTQALPFSGWIVYAYGEENNREIYILDPVTGAQRQLTNNTFMDEAPSFSPDNSQIVFASYRTPDGWELYLYDIETGREQQLTLFEGQARFPQWSSVPGDDRIIFEGREGNSDTVRNIWMVHATSGEMERLTNGNADARPEWSPDGTHVVFGRALFDNTGDGKVTTADSLDIFTLELASHQETRVTNTPENDDFQYTWSPDGQWLAIASVREDTNGDGFENLDDSEDLYVIRLDGSGEQRLDLDRKNAFAPDWSRDGSLLLFMANLSAGKGELWIYELASGQLTRVAGPGAYYHAEFTK